MQTQKVINSVAIDSKRKQISYIILMSSSSKKSVFGNKFLYIMTISRFICQKFQFEFRLIWAQVFACLINCKHGPNRSWQLRSWRIFLESNSISKENGVRHWVSYKVIFGILSPAWWLFWKSVHRLMHHLPVWVLGINMGKQNNPKLRELFHQILQYTRMQVVLIWICNGLWLRMGRA